MLLIFAASLLALAAAQGQCLWGGLTGVCQDLSLCRSENKMFQSGLCPGAANIICCLPAQLCTADTGVQGACETTTGCTAGGGTFVSGKCPFLPADIRCCLGGKNGVGVTRPPVMYAPSGGWFTKIGPYDVERIDEASSLRAFLDHSVAPNKFLVHTIEGLWPQHGDFEVGRNTLNSNGFFPHFLVARDKAGVMRIGQFISTQVQGRACKAPGNTGTIQVEVGGKAVSPFTASDTDLTEAVRMLFQASRGVFPAIANVAPRAFSPSAMAAGVNAPSRVPDSQWNALSGLVGHQHAPANDHWDPGAIDPSMLTRTDVGDTFQTVANGGLSPTPVRTTSSTSARTNPTKPGDTTIDDGQVTPCFFDGQEGVCSTDADCPSSSGWIAGDGGETDVCDSAANEGCCYDKVLSGSTSGTTTRRPTPPPGPTQEFVRPMTSEFIFTNARTVTFAVASSSSLPTYAIAIIVAIGALCLLLLAVVGGVCWFRKRQENNNDEYLSANPIHMANETSMSPVANSNASFNSFNAGHSFNNASGMTIRQVPVGTTRGVAMNSGATISSSAQPLAGFACEFCGKIYPLQSDVVTHKQLRH